MKAPRRRFSVTVLVRDYDEAVEWYCELLGFEVVEDRPLGQGKRWVMLAQPGSPGSQMLLARAASPEQAAQVGNQSGGRVFLFLYTDDFTRDRRAMRAGGVRFLEEPRHEDYGTVAVFLDLYGNKWDLIEPA